MLNVLISVDKDYLDKALTMLFSLHMHSNEEITVYLLNHSLLPSDIESAQEYLAKTCSIALQCINVKDTVFDGMPLGSQHFSIEMYYRLFAQFFLPDCIDRVLWLDADIIVLKSLSDFYHQDFDGKKYVAAADYGVNNLKYWKAIKGKLGLPETYVYFNSGVLLINLECLRKETSEDSIIGKASLIREKLTLPDQDILNYLYHDDVKYADWKIYNYQYSGKNGIETEDFQRIAVLHYVGSNKPWKYWCLNGGSRYYWKIRIQQGYWKEAVVTYWRQIKELTYVYVKTIKELLWK